ncbi:DUF115 domain-containing protein [Dehalococcoidia bacterium]|nr:DUF115 domain-containing protein [Dehalococcoidia bacterium]
MRKVEELAKAVVPPTVGNALRAWQAEPWLQLRWHFSLKRLVCLHRLRKFKNKHLGNRCFVIGNGPSLNLMDLSPLCEEFTFGMNRIYMLFPKLGFHTTYFVSVNKLVIEQCAEDIADLPMPKFLSWRGMSEPVDSANTIFLRSIYNVGFSPNPEKLVYESATVTNVALQLAYYMGFSDVILIGVDHSFTSKGECNTTVVSRGDDSNHFDPNYFGKGFRWQLPDLKTSELGYSIAREVFERDGRRILDATVDGKLKIFPKVNYDDMFDK